MPTIYLSPSTQEFNRYVNGGSEEEWMNRLADAMIPDLLSSGIQYIRNSPNMTAADVIAASNQENCDLHLALHSNASPEGSYGRARGIIVFYSAGSSRGKRAAQLLANDLKVIYPLPDRVRAESTVSIGEVQQVRAPSVFLELGYHDNPDDAAWIKNDLNLIARTIVLALTEYFGIPFLEPVPPRGGVVDLSWGYLNIRSKPSPSASVIAKAYDGARLTILNRWQSWYLVAFDGTVGYTFREYITLI